MTCSDPPAALGASGPCLEDAVADEPVCGRQLGNAVVGRLAVHDAHADLMRGASGAGAAARRRAHVAQSVALVALLPPRVTAVVVAVGLPEAGLVVVEDLQSPHPLGALPEVEMRNQEARGAAVLGSQRLALVFIDDPCLFASHILEWQIGRISP